MINIHNARFASSDGEHTADYRVTRDDDVEPRLVIVAQMGTLSQPEYFDLMADQLAPQGAVCYALPARRRQARRFTQHGADLQRMVEIARRDHPGLPTVVVGVSLGAEIEASWNAHFNRRVRIPYVLMDPVVASKPSWFPLRDLGRVLQALVSRRAAEKPVASPASAGASLTSNPQSAEWQLHDPSATVPAGLFADNVRMALDALLHRDATAPVLVLQAGDDAIAVNAVSRLWARLLPSRDRTIVTVPGVQHDMTQETNHPQVLGTIRPWIARQTGVSLES